MRRRWPALAGTVPLVLGWTVLAAHPASAAAGGVQPGGPIGPASATTSPATSGVSPQVSTGGKTAAGNQAVEQSLNWAGYAATSSTPFTGVTASWTQPTAACTSGNQYAAFWAGLDGYNNNTVEQTGTEADCSGTTPTYSGWYEFYPYGTAVTFDSATYPVKPGDHLTASVTYDASTGFTVTLQSVTEGWTATGSENDPQQVAAAARSSAEVMAEAPYCTNGGGILPLANFGTVTFTGAAATTGTSIQNLDSLSPVEVTMPDTAVSSVSPGDSFSVTYNSASTVGSGGGGGDGGTGGRGGQGGGSGFGHGGTGGRGGGSGFGHGGTGETGGRGGTGDGTGGRDGDGGGALGGFLAGLL